MEFLDAHRDRRQRLLQREVASLVQVHLGVGDVAASGQALSITGARVPARHGSAWPEPGWKIRNVAESKREKQKRR